MEKKLLTQMNFIYEIDKVKNVIRKTKLFSEDRRENDAEHSWHICMMAMIFEEYSNEKIEIDRVIKMLLVHDLVEIYAGDVIVFDAQTEEHEAKELEAAHKIFGLLPKEQYNEFFNLWREFEDRKTSEAKFAKAIDRIEPVMQNHKRNADTWIKYGISPKQVLNMIKVISEGSTTLYEFAHSLVDECIEKEYFK